MCLSHECEIKMGRLLLLIIVFFHYYYSRGGSLDVDVGGCHT